jgi:hypothetical protein
MQSPILVAVICAGAGFLLAVLWMDLMFDIQAAGRGTAPLPEATLRSIAGYYRRVTTDASPMGRLVGVVMAVTLGATVVQAARGAEPLWLRALPILLILIGASLALVRIFPAAVALGARREPAETQSACARMILRAHIVCFACMAALLLVELTGFRGGA